MQPDKVKPILNNILKDSRKAIYDFYDNLSDEERHRASELKAWQARENIIHGLSWCEMFNQAMIDIQQGKTPTIEKDYLAFNDQKYLDTQNQSWEETFTELEAVYKQVSDIVESLSIDELLNSKYHDIFKDHTVASQIIGYYYTHQMYHIADYYYQNQHGTSAIELMLKVAENSSLFDEAPRAKATSLYNVACFFTLMDQFDQALNYLDQALLLAPDLKTWAAEDPDLKKLRGNEKFIALTNPDN
ncbi:MAG: DinB family protein [Anaerolineaceae bacterium]|nr:DinB family protein [Anaerolineaceae bacterium]